MGLLYAEKCYLLSRQAFLSCAVHAFQTMGAFIAKIPYFIFGVFFSESVFFSIRAEEYMQPRRTYTYVHTYTRTHVHMHAYIHTLHTLMLPMYACLWRVATSCACMSEPLCVCVNCV